MTEQDDADIESVEGAVEVPLDAHRRTVDWANAGRPTPFYPLDKANLGRSVERALLDQPRMRLDQVDPFYGSGIYALYYAGALDLYAPISRTEFPIYVGKAIAAGGRKGIVQESPSTHALWARIDDHRASVSAARNLEAADFEVRYLVADEVFIPLAESLMIRQLRPVWNLVVDGFGNHDPGQNRRSGAKPPWDELHPGRWWSELMERPSKISAGRSVSAIAAHFSARPFVGS